MSKMELRSSRSRSRTPFLAQEFVDQQMSAAGNHLEKSVVRTTRRTTVYKTNESASASSSTDEINTSREASSNSKTSARKSGAKGERSLRSRIFKTSDYSSEDGDNEVTSSRTVRQNERNHLVEDARTLVNGSEMPALELYKRSGRYWDVYPKTDWTYSHHSKDRVEIAPGVVAMPNMSRKTIHSLDESNLSHSFESSQTPYSENVSHKNTNTDLYAGGLNEDFTRRMYNNKSEEYLIRRRTYTKWSSFKRTVTTIFTSIFTTIFSVLHLGYRVQTGIFSHIHRAASKVMLWDTYLLWKSRPGDKATMLALLCLLPLLLFGGLWLSSLGGAVVGALSNYTSAATTILPTLNFWSKEYDFERDRRSIEEDHIVQNFEASLGDKVQSISGSQDKLNLEPPTAREIADNLSKEQIQIIALAIKDSLNLADQRSQYNTEELVEKIINNPTFVNVINNYYQAEHLNQQESNNYIPEEQLNQHQTLIDSLFKEIDNMKQEIVMNNKLRSEDYAKLSLDIKKCCEKEPIINVETYVSKIVTDLLNNPEFLNNQRGLNAWLHSLFVAKQDLEYRLGNLTADMDSKLAALVQSNGQLLMDKVAEKLVTTSNQINIDHHSLTDEAYVKKIVKNVLAIYDADRTGLVDYAMENMGGQIVTTRCTEAYHHGKAVVSVLGIPLWHIKNSPRTVITPTIAPGDCWAFQNFPGFVVIKLSNTVKIDAFSMEHISKLLIPEGKMDSAPKDFEVYGLREENDREPVLLGTYTFEYEGDPLQFFLVEKDNQIFDMVEVRIVSNHGNPNYTCLYRFRVHGKVHHEEGR